MLGGHGMADTMCRPQYGLVYLDTTDRIRLYYFEVGGSEVLRCLGLRDLYST